jgi:hypothetical protein
MPLSGAGILPGTVITADLEGGKYTVSVSQTVAPGTIITAEAAPTALPSSAGGSGNAGAGGGAGPNSAVVGGAGGGAALLLLAALVVAAWRRRSIARLAEAAKKKVRQQATIQNPLLRAKVGKVPRPPAGPPPKGAFTAFASAHK